MGACATKLQITDDWEVSLTLNKSLGEQGKVALELLDKAVNITAYDKKSQKVIQRQLHQYVNVEAKVAQPSAAVPAEPLITNL